MALIPSQGGPALVFVAATASDQYENSGAEQIALIVTTPRTITVTTPHGGVEDYSDALPAGSIILPRFDPVWWNDSQGRVTFSFDDPAGVSVAIMLSGVIQSDPTAPPLRGLF